VARFAVRLAAVFRVVPTRQRVHAKSANEVLRVIFLTERGDDFPTQCFATPRTKRIPLLMVMNLAIRKPSELIVRSVESLLAMLANKMLRMPLLIHRCQNLSLDNFVTGSAAIPNIVDQVRLAVRKAVLGIELVSPERLVAFGTDEVILVPFLSQGGNTRSSNGFPTVVTSWAHQGLETLGAQATSVFFVISPNADGVLTVRALEMFRVIAFALCLNDLPSDRLKTFVALGLSSCKSSI